jgi:lysophospholipase L1-like esterase
VDDIEAYWQTDKFRKSVDQHNDVLKQVSQDKNVTLFDFAQLFSKDIKYCWRFKRNAREYLDLYHVNEEGAELRAKMFAEYLVNSGLITEQHTQIQPSMVNQQ